VLFRSVEDCGEHFLLDDLSLKMFNRSRNRTNMQASSTPSCSTSSSVSNIWPEAKHRLSKEHCAFKFSSRIPPALFVSPGELIHVETHDCFFQAITPTNPDVKLDFSKLNPVTGPIYVKGALPGDLLSITIHDIRPVGVGVARCSPSMGQLCHFINQTTTKFFDMHPEGLLTMRESKKNKTKRIAPLSFPISPMLGVIGLAPKGNVDMSTMPAGKHGGNLDNKHNGIGSTIHISVQHPGGLLSIGDMHASQGDGEICGTGVEVAGHVLLSCAILKYDCSVKDRVHFPVTETATHWITHGVVETDIPETTTLACDEAAKLLISQWGFTAAEAFIFLSVKGDLGLCQSCHPDEGTKIAKMVVPKIPACPRPFNRQTSIESITNLKLYQGHE